MMSDQVNPIPHSGQQPENGSSSSQAPQVGKRELTDDEKIDAAAARILETYREAFLELANKRCGLCLVPISHTFFISS